MVLFYAWYSLQILIRTWPYIYARKRNPAQRLDKNVFFITILFFIYFFNLVLLYATVCSNTFQPEIRHRISAAVFIGLTTQNYEQKMEIGSKIKMKKVLKKKRKMGTS